MQKRSAAIPILLFAITANAQIFEGGISGGVSTPWIDICDSNAKAEYTRIFFARFQGGIFTQACLQTDRPSYLRFELRYSPKGDHIVSGNFTYKIKLDYAETSLSYLKFIRSRFLGLNRSGNMYLLGGTSLAVLINAKENFDKNIPVAKSKTSFKDNDLSVLVGAGWKYRKHISFEMRYAYSLLFIRNGKDDDSPIWGMLKNKVWSLNVYYTIQ